MKKGYVLEVKEEHISVMTEDQHFVRLQKPQEIHAGEEILFSENQILDISRTNNRKEDFMKKIKHAKPMGVAAAMVLFLVLSIFAISGGEGEAQYLLSFDVNPSMVIEVGPNEKVLEIYAANEEAKELDLKNLEGESLEVFLDEYLEKLAEKGYLNNETAQVLLSYADLLEDEEASQELIDRVTDQMQNYFTEKNMMVDINTYLVDEENYESARLAGLSLGRFQLIKEIEAQEGKADPSVDEEGKEVEEDESPDLEKYRDMSVRELLDHPVFERHPRDRKADGLHPVFDVHPRDWDKEDGEKPHPVFDEHPGKQGNDDNNEEQDVEEEESLDEGRQDKEKNHPVFEKHPRDLDKEAGEHPVFDPHPRDLEPDENQEEQNKESEADNPPVEKPETPPVVEKPEIPVVDEKPETPPVKIQP